MPQSFACLHHHLIFSTKNRAPLITPGVQPRLFDYVGGILRSEGCALTAAGGMPDHVHLLVSLDRQVSIADALVLLQTEWEGRPARISYNLERRSSHGQEDSQAIHRPGEGRHPAAPSPRTRPRLGSV